MRMIGKIAYNTIATSVSVASGLLRNKIFAAFLSLNLFGVLSLGQQSVSLVVTVCAFGLPLGITTFVSRMLTTSREEQIRSVSRVVVLSFAVSGLLATILAAVVLVQPEILSRAVTATDAYAIPIAVLLFSAPIMLMETCLFAVMEGMGKVHEIIRFRIIPSLVSLPILYIVTAEYHLTGAAVGVLINEMILVGLGLFLLRKEIRFTAGMFDLGSVVTSVYKVAVLSFGVGALWFVSDFVVKRYVLTSLGEVENGIVQSVAKIADLYPTIVLSWLLMHLFPTMSLSGDDKRVAANALQRTALVAVVLIVPIIILLFTFRAEVLQIVYKKEFTVAVDYFGAMLTLGIVKVFSWVIGLAFLPLGMKKHWFYSAVLMTFVYAAGVWSFMSWGFAIYAIPMAYGLGLLVQTAYTVVVYRKQGFVFDHSFKWQMLAYGVLSALLVASVFQPLILIAAALVFAWFTYHHNLITEIRARFDDFRSKFSA